MIYIAVCDDESYFQQYLKKLLSTYMNRHELEHKIDTYASGKELISLEMKLVKYDIIFLDINMIEMDGIETVKEIRKVSLTIKVVFVTAYSSYAIEGYKYNIARYLVKGSDNFLQLLEECLDAVLEEINFKEKKIEYKFADGKKKVTIEKIFYVESNLHKVQFWIMEQELSAYSLSAQLDQVEEQLSRYGFIRIHQSYLVNIKKIEIIKNYKAILIGGKDLPISKSKFKKAREAFIDYKGDL